MGIATGLNCGAGGRAYGAGCVTIGELNSFLSEPIDVWGPVMNTSLVCLFYGFLLAELVIAPLCSKLRVQGAADALWDVPRANLFFVFLMALAFILWLLFFLWTINLWQGSS